MPSRRPPPDPSGQGVPVDRLGDRPDPAVELRADGDGSGAWSPHCWPRGVQCRHRGACQAEAMLRVAEEVVVVRAASSRRSSGHCGLHLHPLRVLPLAFMRVLVASERLRRREVPAAVVALELAAAVGGSCDDGGGTATAALRGGSGGRGGGGLFSLSLRR